MENGNGDRNWRQEIRNLNYFYLNLIKQIGAMPEGSSYAQTVFGLDGERFNLLAGIDSRAMHLLADTRVMLFRPKLSDLDRFIKLCQKDSVDRAASLLVAAVSANTAEGGEG